jgi:hypothetical protein
MRIYELASCIPSVMNGNVPVSVHVHTEVYLVGLEMCTLNVFIHFFSVLCVGDGWQEQQRAVDTFHRCVPRYVLTHIAMWIYI